MGLLGGGRRGGGVSGEVRCTFSWSFFVVMVFAIPFILLLEIVCFLGISIFSLFSSSGPKHLEPAAHLKIFLTLFIYQSLAEDK